MGTCSSRAIAPAAVEVKAASSARSSVEVVPAGRDDTAALIGGSQLQINEFVRKLWLDSQRDALVALLADPQASEQSTHVTRPRCPCWIATCVTMWMTSTV
jgi:hypothetical protein